MGHREGVSQDPLEDPLLVPGAHLRHRVADLVVGSIQHLRFEPIRPISPSSKFVPFNEYYAQ